MSGSRGAVPSAILQENSSRNNLLSSFDLSSSQGVFLERAGALQSALYKGMPFGGIPFLFVVNPC